MAHAGVDGRDARDRDEAVSALGPAAVVAGRRLQARSLLSHRELEVAAHAAHGLSNGELARLFFVSETTVKWHLDHARDKIGARNRMELAAGLWQTGLVDEFVSRAWVPERG